jgi:hypothetical protein
MRLSSLFALAAVSACGDDGSSTTPVLLERLPVDIAAIDYATLAVHFDKYQMPPIGFPLCDFAYFTPPFENAPQGKTAPQLSFWAPENADVLAPVTGTVARIEQLYSGDFTIQYQGNGYFWETEHVLDVRVAVGDTVTAGDVVAKVSNFECEYARRQFGNETLCGLGIGIVEFGLLLPTGEGAQHGCPFDDEYVSPTAAAALATSLDAARMKIETALGDPGFYDPSSWEAPNCIKLGPVDG